MPARKIGSTWWVDFRFERKRYRKRSPLNTRQGALDYEATIRQKLARGEPLTLAIARGQTLSGFAEEWMKTYVATNNKLSEQKSKRFKLAKHILPVLGDLPLHEINEARIERFKMQKREEGLSPKSINNLLTIISKCLQTAFEWNKIVKSPKMQWLRVPPPRTEFLSPEESRALLDAAREEPLWHDMILCGLRTGLRFGEIIGLDWKDINLDLRQINVVRSVVYSVEDSPKNNRTRIVPLCQDIYDCLMARTPKEGRVFTQPNGELLTYGVGQWALERIRVRAGLRLIGWHTLRHSFASQLTASGVPLKAVQDLLGHSTIQMTMRYSHLAPSTLHEAVAILSIRTDTDVEDADKKIIGLAQASPEIGLRVG